MSTKIILVRHGFSVANEKNIYAGIQDYPLSELGLKQAELCGKYFEKSSISAIYSSPLIRAYDTALSISKVKGLEIVIERDLRECEGGDWEGKRYEYLCSHYPFEYGIWVKDIGNAKCPNGESIKDFANRIFSAITNIAEKHDGECICIVTHATPIRVIEAFAKNVPICKLKDIGWCANASINSFIYENGNFSIEEMNNDAYLGGLKTYLPNNV